MKKCLALLVLSLFLISCEKDLNIFKDKYKDSELWFCIDGKIDKLSINFETKNSNGKKEACTVSYEDGKILPEYGKFKDEKGRLWSMVCSGQKESGDLIVTYHGKQFKTKGFSFGEKRYIEIIPTFEGGVKTLDCEISDGEKIIMF